MSPEIALLSETWELVKTHVNAKDRLHVAESMLRLFEENIDIQDINVYMNEFDKVMKTAIVTYFDEGIDDEDEDDEYEY